MQVLNFCLLDPRGRSTPLLSDRGGEQAKKFYSLDSTSLEGGGLPPSYLRVARLNPEPQNPFGFGNDDDLGRRMEHIGHVPTLF